MQATRIRTSRHVTHGATIDGVNVDLTFEPNYEGHILAERVGDKLVVAYLVQDSDPENPQTAGDANGDIYTRSTRGWGGGSISDNDSEIESALGVDGYGSPDIDKLFACEPYIDWKGILQKQRCLRDIAALKMLEDMSSDFDKIEEWLILEDLVLESGETYDQAFNEQRNEIWCNLEDCNGHFCDEVEELAVKLYPDYWQQIAGPFVVPLDYCGSNHGPGTMSINPTTWDGDPDDLPTGIWVADKGAIDNITPYPPGVSMKQVQPYPDSVYGVFKDEVENYRGSWAECKAFIKDFNPPTTDADLRDAAFKYAEGICSSYEAFCNGDVYGCVVEVFDKVGDDDDLEWESDGDDDSCWGFIGSDYALETLKSEYFDPAVKRLQEVAA